MESTEAFIVHKPVGVISCTVDPAITCVVLDKTSPNYNQKRGGESRRTVYGVAEAAGFPTYYSLVGRLDVETSGIMLFTRNTSLDRAVRDPPEDLSSINEYKVKEYILTVLGIRLGLINTDVLIKELEDELSSPFSFNRFGRTFYTNKADVKILERFQEPRLTLGQSHLGWCIRLRVRIQEGKHHQIRRMAKRSKLTVVSLCRTRIAGILSIDTIPAPGDCRWLSVEELQRLYVGLKLYSGEEETTTPLTLEAS